VTLAVAALPEEFPVAFTYRIWPIAAVKVMLA